MDAEMYLGKMYRFADGYFGLLFYFLALSIPSMLSLRMQNDLPRLISKLKIPMVTRIITEFPQSRFRVFVLKSYKASKLFETDHIKYYRIALFRFL